MKVLFVVLSLVSSMALADSKPSFTVTVEQITLAGALEVASGAQAAAKKLNRSVSLAVVGREGETIIVMKGDGVGPHNTEAARRKAFTALSTKTPTLALLRTAKKSSDTQNLAELPELLLLSGGYPILRDGAVIGAIGVAGGGGPEADDQIARDAAAVLKK